MEDDKLNTFGGFEAVWDSLLRDTKQSDDEGLDALIDPSQLKGGTKNDNTTDESVGEGGDDTTSTDADLPRVKDGKSSKGDKQPSFS